jgi:hypothetical protein
LQDLGRAEAAQVIGHELAVEQGEAADLQPPDQPRQRDLRRVGAGGEHAFAEERTAQPYPVESPRQLALMPAFDRMGMAEFMESVEARLDLTVDPGLLAFGAAAHHVAKARSRVTSYTSDRTVLRSERDIRKPPSGRIARRFGSTQKISVASRLSDIGKTPIA